MAVKAGRTQSGKCRIISEDIENREGEEHGDRGRVRHGKKSGEGKESWQGGVRSEYRKDAEEGKR